MPEGQGFKPRHGQGRAPLTCTYFRGKTPEKALKSHRTGLSPVAGNSYTPKKTKRKNNKKTRKIRTKMILFEQKTKYFSKKYFFESSFFGTKSFRF